MQALVDADRLVFTSDAEPGIARLRVEGGFTYAAADGQPIDDDEQVGWIRKLAIPPAWEGVWIAPVRDGHLLATGRDAKGRKQYRYHPAWRAVREAAKFDRMLAFGRALPLVRARVEADLGRKGLGREKVLACVVRLLETTCIRIGNEEYAKRNKSFGLTTLRDRHLAVEGAAVRFSFKGKSGKHHDVTLKSRRLAQLCKRIQDIPGQKLFQYYDEDGLRRPLGSEDVNAYLREITGQDFTAKDFRTWAGTMLAAWALQELEQVDGKAATKRNVTQAIEQVAGRLGNTPAICKKSYVHPEILEGYLDGSLLDALKAEVERELREELAGLQPEEAVVLSFLQRRLALAADQAPREPELAEVTSDTGGEPAIAA